ncbi:Patatin-like phospholipase domain-containing protein [Trichinella spiralis]|uniref:Patatin-like phospholipase domain-containing protein n=1 Tax=Trichinella spiralis TaxID=6334 RepID=A0ABR3KA62_TRISP
MPVSSIRRSEWIPHTLRSSQRIHEVAWNLAYRRHNSELLAESSPIEATISGKHRQGCKYGYGQLHQHIDLMPVSSIRRSKWIPYMLRSSQRIHEVAWSLAYRRHNSEFQGVITNEETCLVT